MTAKNKSEKYTSVTWFCSPKLFVTKVFFPFGEHIYCSNYCSLNSYRITERQKWEKNALLSPYAVALIIYRNASSTQSKRKPGEKVLKVPAIIKPWKPSRAQWEEAVKAHEVHNETTRIRRANFVVKGLAGCVVFLMIARIVLIGHHNPGALGKTSWTRVLSRQFVWIIVLHFLVKLPAKMSRVLVVGAGLTGSLCACLLRREMPSKVHIVVWDKARGPGEIHIFWSQITIILNEWSDKSTGTALLSTWFRVEVFCF